PRVPRLVDFTHATGANGCEDLVRAEAGACREGHKVSTDSTLWSKFVLQHECPNHPAIETVGQAWPVSITSIGTLVVKSFVELFMPTFIQILEELAEAEQTISIPSDEVERMVNRFGDQVRHMGRWNASGDGSLEIPVSVVRDAA